MGTGFLSHSPISSNTARQAEPSSHGRGSAVIQLAASSGDPMTPLFGRAKARAGEGMFSDWDVERFFLGEPRPRLDRCPLFS